MNRERKLSALRRALGDEGYLHLDELAVYCTYSKGCNGRHHKRKLSINVETDIFHCWVCGYKGGSLAPLLRRLGTNDPDYVDYVAELEGKPKAEVSKVFDQVRLPAEFRPLCVPSESPYIRQAIGYLTGRGITSEDILCYKMGYCESGRYGERVILPSFDEFGELNFFVGRGIWERVSPPYLSGHFDKDIIFNDLLVDWKKPIVLVEGPFDAIKAGTNAIPLQGKYPSKKLLDKIQHMQPRVYIALDSDAASDAVKLANQMITMGIETLIVEWPPGVKDPGELNKGQFSQLLDRAQPLATDFDVMRQLVYHSSSVGH